MLKFETIAVCKKIVAEPGLATFAAMPMVANAFASIIAAERNHKFAQQFADISRRKQWKLKR